MESRIENSRRVNKADSASLGPTSSPTSPRIRVNTLRAIIGLIGEPPARRSTIASRMFNCTDSFRTYPAAPALMQASICSSSLDMVMTRISARGLRWRQSRITVTPDPSGNPRSVSNKSIGHCARYSRASRTVPTAEQRMRDGSRSMARQSRRRVTGSSSTTITLHGLGKPNADMLNTWDN